MWYTVCTLYYTNFSNNYLVMYYREIQCVQTPKNVLTSRQRSNINLHSTIQSLVKLVYVLVYAVASVTQ